MSYDLVVVGGGIAGIAAAVQAARQGCRVGQAVCDRYIRYLATDALARVVTFPEEADVLLVYSATVLQNSVTLK